MTERSFIMNEFMDEESGVGELLVKITEENQLRKVLALLDDCKDLDEAKAKVRALLDEKAGA
ncbi:MAG: protein phosphatase [Ruminococcus sp.]|nr:protein phosphatase [Ruminococcus sp.]